jgi:hypothetical protein
MFVEVGMVVESGTSPPPVYESPDLRKLVPDV